MHHRHVETHIPIELLRTAVAIAETGSYTKAARQLGLTQPAISDRVKRLQKILAGEVFDLSGAVPLLTAYGETVVDGARVILSANDELLSLNGSPYNKRRLRVGIPNGIAPSILSGLFEKLAAGTNEVTFRNLSTERLLRGLENGFVDIALLTNPLRPPPVTVAEWWERVYWVKGLNFQLEPDMPVPLVSSMGALSDRIAIPAFKRAGLRYEIAFASIQMNARLAAVSGGVGIMPLPSRAITGKIVIAADPALPELAPIRCGIYLRRALDASRVDRVVHILESQWKQHETHNNMTRSAKQRPNNPKPSKRSKLVRAQSN